jgi:hypothetical protein
MDISPFIDQLMMKFVPDDVQRGRIRRAIQRANAEDCLRAIEQQYRKEVRAIMEAHEKRLKEAPAAPLTSEAEVRSRRRRRRRAA